MSDRVPPLKLRKLKAEMVLKCISLYELAQKTGFDNTLISKILNGRISDEERLQQITEVIHGTQVP